MRKKLRIIALLMLVVAIVFLAYALTHPEAGIVFYVFGVAIGSEVWRALYTLYAIVMAVLLAASFFVKERM